MKSLDDLPLNDAITFYYEKHHAIRQGTKNMEKLLELKNKCPEIFDKEIDAQISGIISYAKKIQASGRYKELRRLELKENVRLLLATTRMTLDEID